MTNRAHILQSSSHGDGWSGGSRGGCGFGSIFLRGGVRWLSGRGCRRWSSAHSSNSNLHSSCNKLLSQKIRQNKRHNKIHKRWMRRNEERGVWERNMTYMILPCFLLSLICFSSLLFQLFFNYSSTSL